MRDLTKMFKPESVAVIGASTSPDKVGHIVVKNLIDGEFNGDIYPINPKGGEILGLTAYSNVKDCPKVPDLVVVAVPSKIVNPSLRECGEIGVKNAIVLTAGFKEVGGEGVKLEEELVDITKEYNINLIGPNSLGMIDSYTPLNSSFSQAMPDKGNIAFISQSGAMMVAIIDWSITAGIGFSKVISVGNKAGVNELDILKSLADDPETAVVICYVESVSEDPEFIKVMREVSIKKPIIFLKSGTSVAGAAAASSHTGALAGSDVAFDSAFKQSGIFRVKNMDDLFKVALAFSTCPLPKGRSVAVITNAGGGGVISVDEMEVQDLDLAKLSDDTLKKLGEVVPDEGSIKNPVDVLGDSPADRYEDTLEILLEADEVDSLIVMVCPTAKTDTDQIAENIVKVTKGADKPVLVVNMGGPSFIKGNELLRENNIPTYVFPEEAVSVIDYLERFSEVQKRNYDDPVGEITDVNKDKVSEIFAKVKEDGRDTLLGSEAYAFAKEYGIDAAPIILSKTPEEAADVAEEMGFPVVLKIASDKILHKSDIGGVQVGINSREEAIDAFNLIMDNVKKAHPDITPDGIEVQKMMDSGIEVLVGMIRDKQFGPMLAFGMGGVFVNLIEDASFKLANGLTSEEIDELISTTKVVKLLEGFRGEAPGDIDSVKNAIVRVARLSLDFPEISELDINPIFVYEEGSSALDIKIKL